MAEDVETIIVGAGVIGLAVAHRLAGAGAEVLVLEQNDRAGAEVSSHNSEVVHAGLYYPPDSIKSAVCVRGRQLLYEFCDTNGVPHETTGKLLVATEEAQLPALRFIQANAHACGVSDLVYLSAREARAREPQLRCAGAVWSPSTGIVDGHALLLALQGNAQANGAEVLVRHRVERIARIRRGSLILRTNAAEISCRNLVLAAGLHTSTLAESLQWPEPYRPPKTFFAKGHYVRLAGSPPFSTLIYPMPDGAWLGIHLTLDLAGRTRFGPDLFWTERIDYSYETGREKAFYDAVRRYWPGLPNNSLQPDYTGVRPKLYRQGQPVADFAVHGPDTHGSPGLVALFGIESPGLTSCLAIAELVERKLANC